VRQTTPSLLDRTLLRPHGRAVAAPGAVRARRGARRRVRGASAEARRRAGRRDGRGARRLRRHGGRGPDAGDTHPAMTRAGRLAVAGAYDGRVLLWAEARTHAAWTPCSWPRGRSRDMRLRARRLRAGRHGLHRRAVRGPPAMSRPGSDTSAQVRAVGADDWRSWRDIRPRALQDSPDAFGSTYELESGFTEDQWRTRLAGPDHVSALAYRATAPIGMGAGFQTSPACCTWSPGGSTVGSRPRRGASGPRRHPRLGPGARIGPAPRRPHRQHRRSTLLRALRLRRDRRAAALRDGSAELVERMLLPPNRDATSLSGRRGCRSPRRRCSACASPRCPRRSSPSPGCSCAASPSGRG
jgi:hypothetical protein